MRNFAAVQGGFQRGEVSRTCGGIQRKPCHQRIRLFSRQLRAQRADGNKRVILAGFGSEQALQRVGGLFGGQA